MRTVNEKEFLAAVLAVIEQLTEQTVGPNAAAMTFADLGVDSLMALELVVHLERSYGLALSEAEIQALRTPNDLVARAGAHGLFMTVEAG